MPIYEYECRNCGRRFEKLVKSGEKVCPPCPDCGSKKCRRIISPAGFVLKGSGWYKTDYPSEARKKGMESEKSDKGEGTAEKKAPAEGAPAKPAAGEAKPAAERAAPAKASKSAAKPTKR